MWLLRINVGTASVLKVSMVRLSLPRNQPSGAHLQCAWQTGSRQRVPRRTLISTSKAIVQQQLPFFYPARLITEILRGMRDTADAGHPGGDPEFPRSLRPVHPTSASQHAALQSPDPSAPTTAWPTEHHEYSIRRWYSPSCQPIQFRNGRGVASPTVRTIRASPTAMLPNSLSDLLQSKMCTCIPKLKLLAMT